MARRLGKLCLLLVGIVHCFGSPITASLPTEEEYWSALMAMFESGPRLTGTAGHKQFQDVVAGTLKDSGFDVHRDEMNFPHWQVSNYSLTVNNDDGTSEAIEVGYPFVRSGLTPPEGLTRGF